MAMVAYLRAPVNRCNYFGHDGTHDPEVTHVFNRNIPLFLDDSSHEWIEVIRMVSYKTLWEIITDAKFSMIYEDMSVKPHFLFGEAVPGGNSFFHYGEEYWYYAQGDLQFSLPA
ncbi:uncharacterized protein A4U43_C02F15880 [Asparagus officinalis]|uniref:Uncharacterized protein n=1 Tax=Asparagus officinalis TaxID=4686 RepID=A0A5P1FNF7_ASPOF|nr:uncharacterized protein A4U43_C02F15880 [Asparagus officinalis]